MVPEGHYRFRQLKRRVNRGIHLVAICNATAGCYYILQNGAFFKSVSCFWTLLKMYSEKYSKGWLKLYFLWLGNFF